MELQFDLSTRFDGFELAAQADVPLQEVTALFGPSGSGKTSILSAIAGFRVGSGSISVDGETWQDTRMHLAPHRRPVGMIFQDGRLFDHLSVEGNLRYASRRADPDGPDIRRDAVLDWLGLEDLLSRRPASLSGGERQRVAIGRALLTRPRLLLMDEPLAALDRERKAAILPVIAGLPETFGTPVVYVSHQLDEIVQVATSLIAIRDGRILGHGPVATMIETMDPAITGRFEAGSLITGTVVELNPAFAMAALEIAGTQLWMPATTGLSHGDTIRVRIRARDVSLAREPVAGLSIRNQLPVTIDAIETDQSAFAELRLSCAGQHLRARITRMAVQALELEAGQQATALIKSVAFDRRLNASRTP
ncbi:MAG: molybdenum ABC transporter ATP-binding protein [Pseudomonadota bacterium]